MSCSAPSGNWTGGSPQISTLKELSDLCYVTFDTEDLFYITLERALKLANADVGSVLILDQPKREFFVVQATIGHGEILRKENGSILPVALPNMPSSTNRHSWSRILRRTSVSVGRIFPIMEQVFPMHALKGINEVLVS